MIQGETVCINGTGETSRGFCFVKNVVQMNILAATTGNPDAVNQVYNVAVNARTSLNELFELLCSQLAPKFAHLREFKPVYRDFRAGDVMHSQADVKKATDLVGYCSTHSVMEGPDEALEWYVSNLGIN